jgi:alpha-glucosidase
MKKNYQVVIFLISLAFCISSVTAQTPLELISPDGRIAIHIRAEDFVEFEVLQDSVAILEYSRISMNVDDDIVLGLKPKIRKRIPAYVNDTIIPVVAEKFKFIREEFTELLLVCKGDYNIRFRAYNNGVAWRFETDFKDDITVNRENLVLNFPSGSNIWFPEEESFFSHNERYYLYETINLISADRFCSLPAMVETAAGHRVVITESGLNDYPGMWLKGTGSNALRGLFPGVALEEEQVRDRNVKVTRYADYIALTEGKRNFPWRILGIAEDDAGLITNQLSYLLADSCAIADPSWIKPGKVAWDWWNSNNVYGVDFKAGINTDTYKYYIDFAAKYGIEYIIMDEGWYELGNLLKVVPAIDMKEIVTYANSKNVGVILWVVWKTLENQWERAFNQFNEWGIKGIKVDFMQRDDQWMVNYYHRVAEEAAKRKLLVDFHGSYKPAGLRRQYPNVISREGLRGLEQSKWSDKNTPEHNVTIPFIRMVAGPMDYTPGAMINANKENFRAINDRPMSMGTRCHQLAMYVVYESPLQMLCDNPSNYMREPECMEFLSVVPTVWDSTVVLSGKIANHIAIARKSGNEWFIGAMTNWDARNLELDLSFLGAGKYSVSIWHDGSNADRFASDYEMTTISATSADKLLIRLAPGGGWVARIIPR